MGQAEPPLRSQRLRMVNHQGDALRLGMNWTEEDTGTSRRTAYALPPSEAVAEFRGAFTPDPAQDECAQA